ncbi:glycoside hydrolase family 30 beta sandwich domain-containing protein [uncultured Limosilactobacillus sp.]|uniref:glycoside hydrolase family 30 protein n=1 Tax=uncultured Limosilactobacillus sp. TaxID=2837629 RepID=UPI0025CE6EE7|nr:glycoside hydrolase family 30 beta sandwich domain-containing protein [uncultured Limosilactobacillus sp.]
MNYQNEFWTITSGDLKQRRDKVATPEFVDHTTNATKIVIDPSDLKQQWVGAGAAITDSAATLLWDDMSAKQRDQILHELFDPAQGGFSMVRVPLGSCDFQSQEFYSYDDIPAGQHDFGLEHFSIGEGEPGSPNATKDLKHIVPVLQEILRINPGLKIIASPWSAPAWMKSNGRLDHGGHLKFGEFCGMGLSKADTYDAVYARYFVKYIEAYQKYGIPIYAVTIQNEPTFASPWPAMIWTLKQLASFGYQYLRPALDRSFPQTKLLFFDDNFLSLTHPLHEDVTPAEASAFDGMALHTYVTGHPQMNYFYSRDYKWPVFLTERRCMMRETVADAAHIMFGTIGNWLIRNGGAGITLWNLALDERGLPNASESTGRRGVITIDHQTGKVQRNLEYFMLRNFGQDVAAGSHIIGSSNYTYDGVHGGLGSAAFLAPDGSLAAHIYNPTDKPLKAAITVSGNGAQWQQVTVPAYGVVTLHKSNHSMNESTVPQDDQFKLNPTPENIAGLEKNN